jgi:hypothetical protein
VCGRALLCVVGSPRLLGCILSNFSDFASFCGVFPLTKGYRFFCDSTCIFNRIEYPGVVQKKLSIF